MTAIHFQPRSNRAAALRRRAAIEALNDAGHWAMTLLGEWRRRIRERNQLVQLDDRMLADIGITRADAEFLANKPFWRQ